MGAMPVMNTPLTFQNGIAFSEKSAEVRLPIFGMSISV
jgi:hypothetical protein